MKGVLLRFPGRRSSWIVIAGWLVLVAIFAPFGAKVADVTNDEYVLPGGSPTAQLQETLRERFPGGDQRPAIFVYKREGGLTEADKQKMVADAAAVRDLKDVEQPIVPFTPGAPPDLVSRDGDVAFTIVPIRVDGIFHVTPTIEEMRERIEAEPPLEVHVTGWSGITADYNSAIKEADLKLFGATVALVLILLIAVYRSPVLALVPLLVVGVAFSVANGIIYLLNQGIGLPVDTSSNSLLVVLMFGAGTDYCLLLVSRYGDRLRRRESAQEALREAIPEAAPPMIASGVTVIAALLTTLAGDLRRLPHLRPRDRDRHRRRPARRPHAPARDAQPPRPPRVLAERPLGGPDLRPCSRGTEGRWRAVGLRVRARPALYLALSLVFLVVAASGLDGLEDRPQPDRAVPDGDRLLGGLRDPGIGVPARHRLPDRDPRRPRVGPGAAVRPRAGLEPRADGARRGESRRHRAAIVGRPRRAAEHDLRGRPVHCPRLSTAPRWCVTRWRTPGRACRSPSATAPGSASMRASLQARDTKVIVPLVLLVVLLTLIILLRALVAPVFLLVTVVISYLATLGLTVVILKYGFDRDGFHSAMPVIIFIFLVALGSDYNIFLMSRVREEAARLGTREGTLNALAATGPVITSAGLILAGTFASLIDHPELGPDPDRSRRRAGRAARHVPRAHDLRARADVARSTSAAGGRRAPRRATRRRSSAVSSRRRSCSASSATTRLGRCSALR